MHTYKKPKIWVWRPEIKQSRPDSQEAINENRTYRKAMAPGANLHAGSSTKELGGEIGTSSLQICSLL